MLHRPGTGGSASAENQSAAAISDGFKRMSPPAYRAVKATIECVRKRPRLAAEVTDVRDPQTDFFAYLPADTFLQGFPRFDESGQDAVKTGPIRVERASRMRPALRTATIIAGTPWGN